MPRGRPKKMTDELIQITPDTPLAPMPVKIVKEQARNPWEGQHPYDDEPVPMRRYRFQHNQQPGVDVEFTRGIIMINRATGRRFNKMFKFKIEDGEEVDMPVEIAEAMMGKMYYEGKTPRPRFSLIPL